MLIEFPDNIPDQQDTIARDNLDRIMNELTQKYYGFILCTCPDCGNIIRFCGDQLEKCTACGSFNDDPLHSSYCPDLFF